MCGRFTRTVQRRPFAVWLSAATLSTLGDSVTFFALGWVASGYGGDAAGLVLTVGGLPLCFLILLGGAIADRFGIRRVMLACDAAMVLVMGVFAVGWLVAVPFWSLLVVALLSGTVAALRRPAHGVFPRLFAGPEQPERLSRLMATTGASLDVARIAGPAVGGVLVAAGGLGVTSALDAATFGLVLVALRVVRPPHEPPAGYHRSSGARRGLVGTLRAARTAPGVPAILLTVVGMALTVLPLVMLCVPLAGRARGWTPGETGAVSAAWLVGTLAVSLVVARQGAAPVRVAAAGPVLAATGVVLLALTRGPVAGVAAQALVGVGTALLTTSLLPAYVASTPADMLARFQSLLGLAQTGPVLLATPSLGLVADRVGLGAALAAVATVLAITAVPAARLGGHAAAQPAGHGAGPPEAVRSTAPRGGPETEAEPAGRGPAVG